MFNQVTLVGRIGQKPTAKQTGNSSVSNFGLATSRSYKEQSGEWKEDTQWHTITCWKELAEKSATYEKGDLVMVQGELRYRKYQAQDGTEKQVTEIVATKLQRISKGATATQAAPAPIQNTASNADPFSNIPSGNDDIPW
jgi:single-strand DNA-binding protein